MRRLLPALALIGATGLAGCNSDGVGGSLATEPVSAAVQPATPTYTVPPGRPCSGEITHYQEVIGRDVQTGNLNRSVYNQIEGELTRAAAACTAGRDAESAAIVHQSRETHGYHA